MSDIKRIIIEYISDGKIHTKKEIEEILLSRNLIKDRNSTEVRNALYLLKSKGMIESAGLGKYKICISNQEDSTTNNTGIFEFEEDELREIIDKLKKEVHTLAVIDYKRCSDKICNEARNKVSMFDELDKCIQVLRN